MRSGFVSIVGRPNVGKSTLLNAIIGSKVAITSSVAGTTRNMIQGIYNDSDSQIVFVDTPGIHKPVDKLGRMLNKQAYYSLSDVDLILFLTDVSTKFGKGDEFILEKLKQEDIPVILVLNKIDKIKYEMILPKIMEYKNLYPFKEIVPVSSLSNKNIDDLVNTIKSYMPEGELYYDRDDVTNVSTTFSLQELIREKVLYCTHEEIPHAVTCVIDDIEEDKNSVTVTASLVCDRENLKKILIGKNGSMVKKIGTAARYEIEKYLNKRVYLDLKVKVVENWRDKDNFLRSIGYDDFLE